MSNYDMAVDGGLGNPHVYGLKESEKSEEIHTTGRPVRPVLARWRTVLSRILLPRRVLAVLLLGGVL